MREWGGKVIFLYRIAYRIADGGADHSYGIQVAKLAGLPKEVIARDVLELLESGNTATLGIPEQMNLFAARAPETPDALHRELRDIDPDDLSPKEAHEFLYRLRELLDGEAE